MGYLIDHRGYVAPKNILTDKQKALIKKELFVVANDKSGYAEPVPFKVYTEDDDNYYLPRYWGLQNICDDPQVRFRRTTNASFKFDKERIRIKQMPIVNKIVDAFLCDTEPMLRDYQNKFINIGTGGGKTVLALATMCLLGKRTLIITHTSPLENQWLERTDEFVSNATIGYIKGQDYQIDGCNVVIAKVQSLMKTKLPIESLLKDFDFVIYDEAHHYCSKVFSNVLRRLPCRFSLALSATIERSDKLDKVLHWYLGDIAYKTEGQLDYDVEIDVIEFKTNNRKLFRELPLPGNKLNTGKMLTNLTLINERNDMIVNKVNKLLIDEPERHVLLITHRLEHIMLLKKEFEKTHDPNEIGLILGTEGVKLLKLEICSQIDISNMKKNEIKEYVNNELFKRGIVVVSKSKKGIDKSKTVSLIGKKIILGIYNLCKEGVDIYSLCTVGLLTPMSAILQCCGRMFRRKRYEYKYKPKVLDFTDNMSMYQYMHRSRLNQYKEAYLDSPESKLIYYTCNESTNFEIKFQREVDLKEFLDKAEKIQSKPKDNPMDSDDE